MPKNKGKVRCRNTPPSIEMTAMNMEMKMLTEVDNREERTGVGERTRTIMRSENLPSRRRVKVRIHLYDSRHILPEDTYPRKEHERYNKEYRLTYLVL